MIKKIIEISGIVILGLIVLGVVTTPEFFQVGFNGILYVQVVIAVIMCCVSLVRAIQGEIPTKVLLLLGFLYFSAGGVIFIGFPDYFIAGTNLQQLGMWHRLSFYALPSIALEGGIGTLLLAHLNRTQKVPRYEKTNKNLSLLFALYTVHFIGLSFLVVLGFATVPWHMAIARTMIVLVIILQAIAWKRDCL